MKNMQKLSILLLTLSFLVAIYFNFYGDLPEKMASHWNIDGQVDGYMDKTAALFFMPAMTLVLLIILFALPKFDPLKKNYASFQKEYDGMVVVFMGFMFYLYILTILYSTGFIFDMMAMLSPAFAGLFYYSAILLAKAKQNWFVGIRTPWTLSSEKVWDKTHAICSKLFKVAAVISFLGLFLPYMLLASIAILLATVVFAFVYSYMEFKKEKEKLSKHKKI